MWRYLLSLLLFTDHVIVPAFYVPLRPLGGRNVGISSVNHVASDAASSYYGTRQPRLAEEAGSVLHAAVTVGGEQMSGESTSAGTKSDVLDFAIIGAGPAGLALAGRYYCCQDTSTVQ